MTTLAIESQIRLIVSFLAALGLFVAVIFWPAGQFDWVSGWVYVGILISSLFVNVVYLLRFNPEVIKHRLRVGAGTKRWDKIWAVVFTPVFLGIYVIAGFDAVRFEWSAMSPWLWPLGLALFMSGMGLTTWSMQVNPFFEKTVRIQTERGHCVVDTGPYGFVRHPGYLGFSAWTISVPLFLGSWWAFLPAFLAIIGIVIRTALEDRTLLRELIGYGEYASRVRYRLIAGIW